MHTFYIYSTDSTQNHTKALSSLHSNGVTFWTQSASQTKGRGQRERDWVSETGNLFLTGCFFNTKIIPGQLSIIIGVLLANILKSCLPKANIGLKWPNDLLIDGKKCGGILIEISDHIYIGIGINISSHPSNTSMPATHLEIYAPINASWLVREITKVISSEFLNIKDFSIYQQLWWNFAKDFIPFWNVNINGEILGIDTHGQLLIKESEGNITSRHQTFT